MPLGQSDGADLPPLGRLTTMGGPPIGMELRLVGIGVQREICDSPGASDSEPMGDIGGKIELVMALSADSEKPVVTSVKLAAHVLCDLVTGLGDRRADGCADAYTIGAKILHSSKRSFQHAGPRAFPTGMRSTDNPGLDVGEKNRGAIGRHDTQQKSWPVGHQSVTLPDIAPRLAHHADVGRMDLLQFDERCAGENICAFQPIARGEAVGYACQRIGNQNLSQGNA